MPSSIWDEACKCPASSSRKRLICFFTVRQVGLRKEARQHPRGEREGAIEAQVQEGVQGRSEGDQEGLALPGQREAQRGHEQVGTARSVKAKCFCEMILSAKAANFSLVLCFQRRREKEEGEGTLWQFGHSGGRVEDPEEEEEEVKESQSPSLLSITCSLSNGHLQRWITTCTRLKSVELRTLCIIF